MNQILDYDVSGNKDNNKKNSFNNNFDGNNNYNNNGGGKSSVSDKVVKVFAFLMILLAIALIFSGVTSILKNKNETTSKKITSNKNSNNTTTDTEILAELDEETGKIKITVNSPVIISKMLYSWDQGHDNVVSGEKQKTLEEEIIAQSGEHVLYVQVIDEQNNKTTKDFTFNSDTGIDTTQPEIVLSITEDKKLLVTATDDTSIAYVTYTWNNEENVKMTPETEGLKKYEFELDIPKGKNTIVVFAIDGSESANAQSVTKTLEGVTKPEINYGFLDSTGAVLQITCLHENGIQKIYYTLNGQPFQWENPEGEEAPKELSFQQESVPGHNEMTITVTSVDGTIAEFNPVWEYGSTQEELNETDNEEHDNEEYNNEEHDIEEN